MKIIVLMSLFATTFLAQANEVRYSKIVNTNVAGQMHVQNIVLVSEGIEHRIKFSQTNKNKICKDLGFSTSGGSRAEFNVSESVVDINKSMEIKRFMPLETTFIHNLNCII
jgi:hypothetical protein